MQIGVVVDLRDVAERVDGAHKRGGAGHQPCNFEICMCRPLQPSLAFGKKMTSRDAAASASSAASSAGSGPTRPKAKHASVACRPTRTTCFRIASRRARIDERSSRRRAAAGRACATAARVVGAGRRFWRLGLSPRPRRRRSVAVSPAAHAAAATFPMILYDATSLRAALVVKLHGIPLAASARRPDRRFRHGALCAQCLARCGVEPPPPRAAAAAAGAAATRRRRAARHAWSCVERPLEISPAACGDAELAVEGRGDGRARRACRRLAVQRPRSVTQPERRHRLVRRKG